MKKSLLTSMLAVAALSMYADDPETFNFFDPADCDSEGWLWLDTPEKIAKYVGSDKKIRLINSSLEIEDPEFPGEYLSPETVADASAKGYNDKGEEGGEGSKTGGIILPEADEHGIFGSPGGGFLIQLPDCAQFDLYMSQKLPGVYTWICAARGYVDTLDPNGNYVWNEDDTSWDSEAEVGPLKGVTYAGYDMNIQYIKYDLSLGDGTDYLQIYGPKGEKRTAGFYNFSLCPMLVQGIRIYTYTDVSLDQNAAVDAIVAGVELKINGKTVVASSPVDINVYNAEGVKVAATYGTSLDCSALKGFYIVKAGNRSVKAVF